MVLLQKVLKELNNNPNIVHFYDYFDLKDRKWHCILMEYVDGMNLLDYDKKYKLSFNDVIYVGLWTLKMLIFLHDRGYAYNDIKEENIMVTTNRKLKLIDLGLVCSDKNRANENLKCKMLFGTMPYTSPEKVNKLINKNPNYYTKTSDVYATGMMIYILFTGKEPYLYDGDKINSKYYHVDDKCLDKVLQKMLSIDVDKRPTAKEAYTLLKKCH